MNVIITMAGRGSRFAKQGYSEPKYMIEVKGKTLFEWSLESLQGVPEAATWYFVALKEHDVSDFVHEKCALLGINDVTIVEIDDVTTGQAESALQAVKLCEPSSPCLIFNIDTHVAPGSLGFEGIKGEGWIPCFTMPGDNWSFVRLGDGGCAVEVREKKRISDHCSIGLYWFSKASLFTESYEVLYGNGAVEAGETYVAPLYNVLIEQGSCVTVALVNSENVVPLGTPEEVRAFALRG